jgi:hypothetical protein
MGRNIFMTRGAFGQFVVPEMVIYCSESMEPRLLAPYSEPAKSVGVFTIYCCEWLY